MVQISGGQTTERGSSVLVVIRPEQRECFLDDFLKEIGRGRAKKLGTAVAPVEILDLVGKDNAVNVGIAWDLNLPGVSFDLTGNVTAWKST